MTTNTHVRLQKVEATNPITLYRESYYSQGHLVADIEVGKPIRMARYLRAARDDEKQEQDRPGIFTSSPVQSIEGDLVRTRNSVWKVIPLEPIPVTHSPFEA